MSGPVRERLAVIQCGGRQGSGYLLTPHLVLTAAHLVAEGKGIRVTAPGGPEVPGARVWSWATDDTGLDAGLLWCTQPLAGPSHFGQDRWARITSLAPISGCQAIGFPYVQRGAGGLLDSEQLTGTCKPGSGLFSGHTVLTVDGAPPESRPDGRSPWAGMSGAAVFAGDVLLGVVGTEPQGWRHGRVSLSPLHRLLDVGTFRDALNSYGYSAVRLTDPPGQPTGEAADFEYRYGAYLAKRHGTLRIFGIDLTDRRRATWPLDTAYYSLEAAPSTVRDGGGPPGPFPLGEGPIPAERALAGHDRVLLRGVAGSGKTTLVQWLAVTAARQELGEHLQHLRDLVPYVLPLRTIARRERLPAPADFLTAVAAPLTAPPGWVEAVLSERRALILVDGLDEVDERARERVGDWLRDLLAAYPGNRWLVTSRPSAVADSWLADEGFAELTLAPMSRRDLLAFVRRWHDAARETVPDDLAERARLDTYERGLTGALQTKQDLARLATNPLMCGLVCALHRDRSGYLPTGRKELYDAALSMLLIRRDRERDLDPRLTEGPQIQLLQKLAYWLVKNGQAEMDRADALHLITGALPSMPSVAAALGDAPTVYRYLLDRSGVLREPTSGTVDFIHRTFQDYLAARAAVEELDFDLLAASAHHDQWSDVIRMAVAHARPAERARLLRGIIDRGDRAPQDGTRLHLLATACLEHATELDPQVRLAVEERAERLLPPQTLADAQALADVGPIVLELLPGPEGLGDDERAAVISTAQLVGGDAAVPLLARYAENPSRAVRRELAVFPRGVDLDLYVTEVFSRIIGPDLVIMAVTAEELTALTRLRDVRRLLLGSPELVERLDLLTAFPLLVRLSLTWPVREPTDVAPLAALPALSRIDTLGPVLNAHRLPHVKITVHG